MNLNKEPITRSARDRERGQVFVLTLACMAGILSIAAFVVDVANLFASYQQLLAATQASAMAGATQMKADYLAGNSTSTAPTVAGYYSAVAAGDMNAVYSGLQGVAMVSPFPEMIQLGGSGSNCGTGDVFPDNLPCYVFTNTPGGLTGGGANAIVVRQQATVPMFFARIFGVNSITVVANATAVPSGGPPIPFDMAVIADSTASMNSSDPDATCTLTRIECVKLGIQGLLSVLAPCVGSPTSTNCTVTPAGGQPGYLTETAYNVGAPIEEVALFTFPGLLTTAANYGTYSAYVPNEYCSASGTVSIGVYDGVAGATPDATCAAGTPCPGQPYYPPTYEIVPLSSNYLKGGVGSGLNTASNLVNAVGGNFAGSLDTTCAGLQSPGGVRTFYAGVINQAQAMLVANFRSNTDPTRCATSTACAQNVIVLVSDGEANSPNPAPNGEANMIGYPPNVPAFPNLAIPISGTTGECRESVEAAQAAATAGTDFYAVSYGGETTGCTTDTAPYNSPCYAMSQMASAPGTPGDANFFFADVTASQSGCKSIKNPVQGLVNIFKVIANNLTRGRLVPNGTQ